MEKLSEIVKLRTRAERIRGEIDQIFTDAEHWNSLVRTPGEGAIDPDPDGRMAAMRDSLDKFIADACRIGVAMSCEAPGKAMGSSSKVEG